jgi:molybdopterin converting factor small subunit
MRVTVRFHGIVGDIAKRKVQEIELRPGATVADLMADVAAGNAAFGGAAKQVRTVVNGENASKETPLADGDDVVFMRAIGGGA